MKRSIFALSAVAAASICPSLSAFEPPADQPAEAPAAAPEVKPLTIGDPAPAFDISNWVKGTPIPAYEAGKIYVMEFWATWCPPCRDSMPHLSKLQEEYKDKNVTIIGVSDEDLETVTTFLNQEGWPEKTNYTLATDPDRSIYQGYMEAAGQNGIPTAFLVGTDSKIQWIGHPMELDKVLKKVVAGKWDVEKAKARMKLDNQWQEQMGANDFDGALKTLDEIIAADPDENFAPMVKFYILLTQKNDSTAAYAIAKDSVKKVWDDKEMLMQYAGLISQAPGDFTRDWDLALSAAERAVELGKGEDAESLFVLANVYHGKGNLDKAIETGQKAVEKAAGDDEKAQIQAMVDTFIAERKSDG